MAGSSSARRERAPKPHHALLTAPFDGYPYLVTRIGHSAMRHLAVLPTDWSAEQLVRLTRRQALANRLDTCLVLGAEHAVYVGAAGAEAEATFVPTGLPVVEQLALAEELPATPELAARQAALRAWAHAQIHEGKGHSAPGPARRRPGAGGAAAAARGPPPRPPSGAHALSHLRRAGRRLPHHPRRGEWR